MRDLIERMQTQGSAGQVHAPAGLLHILVHIANIQTLADQSSEDPTNAVKRLRDFAKTIDRIDLGGENMADARHVRVQLTAVLRLAANQFGEPAAAEITTSGDDPSAAS
jgi:hypothetical protein